MSAYLLNLIFAHPGSISSATGIFNDYNASDPVGAQSKAWYEISPGWPSSPPSGPGLVNQPAMLAAWGQSETPVPDKPAHGQSDFSCDLGDSVYIRIAADSSWNSAGGAPNNLDGLIAAFGRPNSNHHDGDSIASPFVLGGLTGQGQNSPCSYFAVVTPANTTIAPLPDNSWILYLGTVQQNGPGKSSGRCPGGQCTYSFIVGAGIWQGSNLYTYGHDPKIIVTPGNK
ncbi:MAG TPA: hypothetical protein VFB76_05610 [Candidatus Angelobacter sp.]|nr:hypothetical protein [Candidatus Angelobacter sp.]